MKLHLWLGCMILAICHFSCQSEHVVEREIKACDADDKWRTRFLQEVKNGNIPSVKAMLTEKSCTNIADESITALMVAAANGRREVAKILLDHGAEVDAKAESGDTALILASKNCQPSLVMLLVESGAYVPMRNFGGKSSLESAKKLSDFYTEYTLRTSGDKYAGDVGIAWQLSERVSRTDNQWIGTALPQASCGEVVKLLTAAADKGQEEQIR